MDVNEYISSGAIEACVMGVADERDWKELEQMAALYPEVKEYRKQFELEQEAIHLKQAIAVPAGLKDQIFKSLPFEKPAKQETPVIAIPAAAPGNHKPQVVQIIPTPKSVKWLQSAVAVSILLLMGSIILNFYFYSKSVSYRNQYNTLVVAQNSLLVKNKAMEASFNMIKSPAVKQVTMPASAPRFEGSLATVYWDNKSKDVYLMVNNLPRPVAGKQYQLWAIVNGKPVDAGMLTMGERDDNDILHKMRNIPIAEAFAITLEKEGGSPTPDMNALYVIGKV